MSDYADPNADVAHADRLTKCYQLAGAFSLANRTTRLVHGTIQGMGHPRIAHAWVILPGGSVWEPITAATYTPEVFSGFFHAEEHHNYRNHDMRELAMFAKHWGPWEEPGPDVLPFRQESDPKEVTA